MPEQNDKVYEFAPLSGYSSNKRFLIRLADILFFASIKFTGMMTKIEVQGLENLEAIESAGKTPIYTFWHDRIFLSTYFWRKRGIVVMTSQSFDGEYIARIHSGGSATSRYAVRRHAAGQRHWSRRSRRCAPVTQWHSRLTAHAALATK